MSLTNIHCQTVNHRWHASLAAEISRISISVVYIYHQNFLHQFFQKSCIMTEKIHAYKKTKYCVIPYGNQHPIVLRRITIKKLSLLYLYCWLGLLTCKKRLPYNLYCVGGDVKHCSIKFIFNFTHCTAVDNIKTS